MDLDFHISPCLGTVFTNSSMWDKNARDNPRTELWNPGTSKGNVKTTKLECQVTASHPSLQLQKRHQGLVLLKSEQNPRCYFWGFAELKTELNSIAMELNWINKRVGLSGTFWKSQFWRQILVAVCSLLLLITIHAKPHPGQSYRL